MSAPHLDADATHLSSPGSSTWRARLPPRGQARGMAAWAEHFRGRLGMPATVPWASGTSMSLEEQAFIIPSLQAFQRGESSEGRHLLRAAARQAERVGDPAWLEAVRLHIRDEQHHAALLARVLEIHGAAPLESCWTDAVFRVLRRFTGGLGAQVVVLTAAELLAMTYYRAVHDATDSTILRAVCRRILADEVGHLRFQAESFARMRVEHGHVRRVFGLTALRTVHGAASGVLWLEHGRVLRAGGFDRQRFRVDTQRWLERFVSEMSALSVM